MSEPQKSEFESISAKDHQGGLARDVWGFLKESRKWWLIPVVVALLVLALFVYLSGTAVAPFIYTLF
jgi:hypothetical protein